MKIIYVLTDANIGGAGRWLLNMLRFSPRENEVKVLLPDGSKLLAPVRELGFETLELRNMADRSWDGASLGAMTALFRREKPDIVHVGASLTARIAARRARVGALVVTKHCAAERGSLPSRLAHGAVDTVLCDAMVAVSAAVGEELKAAGTPKRRVHVIPNGITPAEASPARAAALREELGLDETYRWVGIAARLEEVKGVDLFLEAAAQLPRDDVRFAVFGSGTQEEKLRALASPLGERVRFLGFCSEIEQALSLLDVAVVSSRSEAFCLSAAEALSMGTPVAAFDVDGVGEVVRDGETGLLAPAADTAALARAIGRLLDDEALREKLGAQGRALVLREFTAQRMAERTQALYKALLEKGRRA